MARLTKSATERIDKILSSDNITQAMLEDWLRDRGMAVVDARDLQEIKTDVILHLGEEMWNTNLDN